MNNSIFNGVLQGTSNVFNAIDGFMTDSSIDVMYKALATIGALFMFYAIPPLRKFTLWAMFALLFILMLQSQPNATQGTPASSALPLPTQINTPWFVPQTGSSAQSSTGQQSSGGGFDLQTLIQTAATILPFFGIP